MLNYNKQNILSNSSHLIFLCVFLTAPFSSCGGGSPERANEMAELIGVGGARSPDNNQSDSQDSIAVSNP